MSKRDWECTRCGSFGMTDEDGAHSCDCDETDDNLRATLEMSEAENTALKARIQELLSTIVRVTNERDTAVTERIEANERRRKAEKDALEQRGKLVAEVGTLKAERDELHRELKAVVDYAIDVVGMPARAMLGPDAPVRVMRHLHAQLNHAVSENMAFNVKVAGEINEARQERDKALAAADRMRGVYEAAIEWHAWYGTDDGECLSEKAEALWNAIDAVTKEKP